MGTQKTCSFPGCTKPFEALGSCRGHYAQIRTGRPLAPLLPTNEPLEVRFWAKVDRSGGPNACWLWTGANRRGHGVISVGKKVLVGAHRVAYELARGPIPAGLVVRHFACANPRCVNPAHLEVGTVKDNSADAIRDGAQPRGERHGAAKLTDDLVRQARELHASGHSSYAIAKRFGVAQSTIMDVFWGVTWKHV